MSRDALTIDRLDTTAFAGGHPWEQYRWLRENAPVYRHGQPVGQGFSVVSIHARVCEGARAR